jgi:hypothetical protein
MWLIALYWTEEVRKWMMTQRPQSALATRGIETRVMRAGKRTRTSDGNNGNIEYRG